MAENGHEKLETRSTVEYIDGRLHKIRSTYDESGNVVQQVLRPLMVEFRFQDVCEIVVGASTLAIPVAFTEEVWNLSAELPWVNVIGVLVTSVVTVALFVYFVYFKGHFRSHVPEFLTRTFAGYAVTLLVVAIILVLFQKFPLQTDPATAIRRVILVGFPACYSATVVDSLK